MKTFSDRLIDQCRIKNSHVVVGLDPVFENIPTTITKGRDHSLVDISNAIVEFNCAIIDAVKDIVPAIKPQMAFYERFGAPGVDAFLRTAEHGKKNGLIVIEDAKRNDISSTAAAYADGHIGKTLVGGKETDVYGVDSITVNPFLGSDGIYPFVKNIEKYQKGIFVLVKTSNPSSVEIQDLVTVNHGEASKVFEKIALLVNDWGKSSVGQYGYSSVGAVVGGTFPQDAKKLRKLMPKAIFLVPGYGTQGGSVSDVVNYFNEDGYGALIASSRSINYAYKGNNKFIDAEFAEAARDAAASMNTEINHVLERAGLLRF